MAMSPALSFAFSDATFAFSCIVPSPLHIQQRRHKQAGGEPRDGREADSAILPPAQSAQDSDVCLMSCAAFDAFTSAFSAATFALSFAFSAVELPP
ncbi:hypothetical protein C4D60_Mb05t08770 [Musa balbisiana]|uniref:Uncharacterized protein n=1 Tax=Musa balbisiana TaxID=52838 RepID=A0A4V4H806_MUSBA|nr:hypothetical protein C4D60_Mb05t08770 [Musa balbisiana]